MIFVREGRAKEGEDAIAGGLGHVTFVAMDRLHHQSQDGIDNGAGVFGVEVLHERHRAFDVGKEGGDGLALAIDGSSGFQCCLLGQDTLSEMLGSVENRACGSAVAAGFPAPFLPLPLCPWGAFAAGFAGERRATLTAELGLRGILTATLGAAPCERAPALVTKLQPFGILKPTAGTSHTASLLLCTRRGKEKA